MARNDVLDEPMILEPTRLGVILGLPVGLTYLFVCHRVKMKPKLKDFLRILILSVSAVVNVWISILMLSTDDTGLGPLASYRLAIVVGAVVVVWLSVEKMCKIWARLRKKHEANRVRDRQSALSGTARN